MKFPVSSLIVGNTKKALLLQLQASSDAFNSVCNKQLKQEYEASDDNSSLDSCDAMFTEMYLAPFTELTAKKNALRSFCDDLISNVVFSAGFDIAYKKKLGLTLQIVNFATVIVPVVVKWLSGRNNSTNHRLVDLTSL